MTTNPSTTLTADLISRYNVSGPRYTSYPTALQFENLIDLNLPQAIEESPWRDHDISLYLHLPFCAKLCYYCACNKVVTKKYDQVPAYLAALETEVSLYAKHLKERRVSQLHWGGGTPTFLNDHDIKWLMNLLHQKFNFVPEDTGEFGIEIDPRTVNEDRIDVLREAGFNRLSMGIQDFDPTVQKAVNRVQGFEETLGIVERARQLAFQSISVDLIYGLPFQSAASFERTLNAVVAINPDRISVFNYAHLPDRFPPQRRIIGTDLPSPSEKLTILQCCTETLIKAGYIYIGMDHFARPEDELAVAKKEGTLHRNFQGYSTFAEADMFAFGATAISRVGHRYWQNSKTLESYQASLDANQLPVERGVVIDFDDQVRGQVIQSLICQFRLDFQTLDDVFGICTSTYFTAEISRLKTFEADGLLNIHKQGIEVTEAGRFLIRNICMVFDRYVGKAEPAGRLAYSRAI